MSNTLNLINTNKTHYPFDLINCSLPLIADCIECDFKTYTSIPDLSLLSLNFEDDKKQHFHKQTVENLKKVLVSSSPKKFFIMDCNNFDNEDTLNTFINNTRRIFNLLHQVTTNFQIIAYFHIVAGYSTHTVNICNDPNLIIEKIYTWTPSNNSRFEDIMDNIFFKNELITKVYN